MRDLDTVKEEFLSKGYSFVRNAIDVSLFEAAFAGESNALDSYFSGKPPRACRSSLG